MFCGLKSNLNKFLRKRRLKCFKEELKKIRSYKMVDLGVRVIEVKWIVGSVDKCDVLDRRFRNIENRSQLEHYRMAKLDRKAAAVHIGQYTFMPKIEVYLLNNDYYVVDGHRRVAAAKTHGIEYLDAHVVEYVDQDNPKAVKGVNFQRKFERETRLKEPIILNCKYGYGTLLREVSSFPEGKDTSEKSSKWIAQVFLPFLEAIRNSPLPSVYRDLRAEDIYVIIADFYHEFMGEMLLNSSPDTLISGFLFARKIPQRRLYRMFPFRVLLSFLKRAI